MERNQKKNKEHHPLSLANVSLCLLFLGVGALFLYMAIPALSTIYASREWMPTRGRILESRMAKGCDDNSKYSNCRPVIIYRYSIEGQTYIGNSIRAASNNSMRRAAAEAQLRRYPEGQGVIVFYDRHQLNSSCLEPGLVKWSIYGVLVLGILAIVSSFQCVWLLAKSKNR